ncbi:hypothetical protein EDB19DRAFT_1982797 [Suillus lakei]|nr:hypothetical protein EDB19DRAFT_1982797 [Suillus lakei]
MNMIPIHLIRLSDMKIVERNDVKKHFCSSVSKLDSHVLFLPADYAKYAILSHRWLREGEPTYEEMKARAAAGPGYGKLKKFCKNAKKYGMEFAWSDTCCIDRSSSTELDESIRSMFRWGDEWTERSWTLQELLALHKIKFFNVRWMSTTDGENGKAPSMKPDRSDDILRVLEEATGIPRDVR